MATITFTPSMLRGAGTRGIPEISGGGGGDTTESSIQFFQKVQYNSIGANPQTPNWPVTISASDSTSTIWYGQSYGQPYPVMTNTFQLWSAPISSGKGGTNYKNVRIYLEKIMGGATQGVPGTISSANLYLPVSKSADASQPGVYGGEIGIFVGNTGSYSSLTNTNSDYPLYWSSSISGGVTYGSNKIQLSPFQEISSDGLFTYPLNETAITMLNDLNSSGIVSESIAFAVIMNFDFTGTTPTENFRYELAITASGIDTTTIPGGNSSVREIISSGQKWVNPYLEFTYIPD